MAHPPLRIVETARGPIGIHDFGGPSNAPLVHFAHANGFNGPTYRALLEPLVDFCRIIAWDARGHGRSPLPADPALLRSWDIYSDDLAALIDALNEPIFLAGHSLGASASLLAADVQLQHVRGLLLLEPVLPPSALAAGLGIARRIGVGAVINPLARAALRRRRHFDGPEAMIEAYSGRGAFKTWPREMLADYVAGGTRICDGGGIILACAPEWEAATFMSLPGNLQPALRRFKAPLALLCGTRNSTCPPAMVEKLRAAKPDSVLTRVDGTSHFLPMERPDLVRAALKALISS